MSKITYGNKSNTKPVANESTQVSAENMNEIKSSVNALYENPNNGTVPTTATVGYLLEERVDASGNIWKLIKIDGSTYYWSPDGFPANNTEYLAYFENGTPVYKYRRCL